MARAPLLLAALLLAACDSGSQPEDASLDASSDAAADALADGGDGGLTECGYPDSDYGLATGDVLEPFLLWDCDGLQTSLSRLWCGQRVTILHFSTGWCTVCEDATEGLLAEVLGPLEGQPVRLVEIFVEEGPDVVATTYGCRYWSRQFDPPLDVYVPPAATLEGSLGHLATSGAPPLTLLLDDGGHIRDWHRTMVPDMIPTDLQRLRRTIEEILEEPPRSD